MATPLTSAWVGRTRERALLTSLLQPTRCVGSVVVFGASGQGKTTLVLDVLTSANAHFAYVDTSHADRYLIRRLTQQVQVAATDRTAGRALLRRLCAAGVEGEDEDASGAKLAPEHRGRKRKSVAPEMVGEIPQHPDAMVDDLLGRADKAKLSMVAAAANAADAPLSAAAASAATITFQSSTRSQLTELVRSITSLRHAAFLGNAAPETLYLVLDNVHRLADGPALLSALCALPAHTQYPVSLVLIAPSLSQPDAASGMFGLPHHLASQFLPLRLAPYSSKHVAHILASKLWATNRHIEATFRDAAATSTPSAASTLPPALASVAFDAFRDFIERVCEVFAEALANSIYETETQVRLLLPRYLSLLRGLVRSGHVSLQDASFDSSALSARILQQMDQELKQRFATVWQIAEPQSSGDNDSATMGSPKRKKPMLVAPSLAPSAAATATPAAAAPASVTPRAVAPIRGSLGLPGRGPSTPHCSSLTLLSRTSKFLLLASFLASYNPASADTSLFTTTRAKWNRRGKSAAVERKRATFDAASQSASAQATQLSLGPNAAPLERVLAIYQVICDEDRGGGGGLSSCYAQLKALLAAHLLEQIIVGGGGARRGDLLHGVKLRCLVSQETMERVCDSIEGKPAAPSGATAAAGAPRMGERITLATYLYDGAKRK